MYATRKKLDVRGIVQGVGFRPWVCNLARSLGLSGYVLNSSSGVTIEVEGLPESVAAFLDELASHPPALAQIDDLTIAEAKPSGEAGFVIHRSIRAEEEFSLVPADIATCGECYADFTSPANRRFHYPFTNCTNCGPRYTIIRDIPYDRPHTTMDEFSMCPACQAEYSNPDDRRFHAQPNACPVCGPQIELWDKEKRIESGAAALERVRELLRDGRIVAVKGLGGFHLACDATNDAAVKLLRERKRRSGKPFALMAGDADSVERFCDLSAAERRALLGPRRPIVILNRREDDRGISAAVAPGNRTLGVMLPYTPLHFLLFEGEPTFLALVMTSGNLSEEPIASQNDEVAPRLHALCDYFLVHNRKIQTRVDDSVVHCFEGKERVLRRSRGYAPNPIDLGIPLHPVLAMGGELKSTFCLTKSHYAILSQHIGDLENFETKAFFEETLEHMKRFFRVEPEIVAHDLHPRYLSTQMAQAMPGITTIGVQHHHAHIASCMAENGLSGKVIGVALDGTGYGTDGKIWGGEFLVCDDEEFERRAHLRYVPLAGGDAGVREPWRMGLSYLLDTFGGSALQLDVPFLRAIPESRIRAVARMIAKSVNTVETSSCGRLFDAISSLLDVRHEITYEGQAAIELEMLAAAGAAEEYPFSIAGEEIDLRPAIEAIVREVRAGESVRTIAAKFHNTAAEIIAAMCGHLRASDHLNRVCLSGGTFQNFTLLDRAVVLLRGRGFEVFVHSRVPPNDGGLSLGQAVIANHILSGGRACSGGSSWG